MMGALSIVADSADSAVHIGRQVAGIFATRTFVRDRLPRAKPTKSTIIDIDLTNRAHFSDLKLWLERRPRGGKVIFAVERGMSGEAVQAFALGATDVVDRPIDSRVLLTKLFGDIGSLFDDATSPAVNSEGVLQGEGALRSIFLSAVSEAPVDLKTIDAAGKAVVSHIESEGLVRWIDTVRNHRSQTYQHCLLVTGVAVTFGQQLGFANADKKKLAFAGLLHDIGKARIPLAILEKPGPLDAAETKIMKQHPLLGLETLQGMKAIDPDMLDMVVHHHEYLDGSGYPHGLKANQLSDLVRIITIADVFGALIERRSYKPPMSGVQAYQVLEQMGAKLDKNLVREFRPISLLKAR
ncbi:MAG: HD domain-containing protein [Bradyrhizobiaceae bacterium]|nr:HD domain-containing protein [Bradyrhizobiaceae bacterium]